MTAEERDETADWLVPEDRRPPSVFELQQQIDVALGVARASEAAALEIGAASLEAAEQARRAAGLAERASEASLAAARSAAAQAVATTAAAQSSPPREEPALPGEETAPPARITGTAERTPRPAAQPDPFDERMVAFRERAEKVMARLRRLEDASPVS